MVSAAQKAALKRRKQQSRVNVHVSDIQNQEVRDAIVEKLTVILGSSADAREISTQIENQLFESHGGVNAEYRSAFRKILVPLKNKSTNFAQMLLDKEIAPREFAVKKPEDLKSKAQKSKDNQLRSKAIQESIGQELTIDKIQQIHDGRDREKWGVSRSAAAVDD